MARGGKRQGAGRKPNQHKGKSSGYVPSETAPRTYDPSVVEEAKKLYELGATDVDVADFLGVEVRTIYRWKIEFPEFSQAAQIGKEACDARVEKSLYHRAVGYTFDAVKIVTVAGKVVKVPYREHVPPDVAAQKMWLNNRQPERWRDKVVNEHTGKDGGPIEVTKIERVIVRPANPDG